jgi:hypothetical protein
VRAGLSVYLANQLPPREAASIEEHLAACADCRKKLEEVELGMRLARKIPLVSAPDALWISIGKALDAPAPAGRARFGRALSWGLRLVAVAVLLVGFASVWYWGFRERLHLSLSAAAPSALELAALGEHRDRVRGATNWEVEDPGIPAIRNWVEATTGLSATIPSARPSEDRQWLRMVGARTIRIDSAAAVEIGYEVRAQPVTLLTARLEDLQDPPRDARFFKDVWYRRENGYGVLTWGSDGQAYVMISSLPAYGQQGCFLCHTTPERRRLISDMSPLRASTP